MAKQVPFINRENELAQIDRAIGEWGTRCIICLQAEGGIGKTRLLQEVYRRYGARVADRDPLIVADIIDLDDQTFHIPINMMTRLARMLDERLHEIAFDPYLQDIQDLRQLETAPVSARRVAQVEQEARQTFQDCFNKVLSQHRIVWFIDTTDALQGADALDYLIPLLENAKNYVLLVAGRNVAEIGESLRDSFGEDVQVINLPPLEREAGESYLRQKLDVLHITLEPELARKIVLLAGGRPILIDLAAEWLAREIPLDWLVESSQEELVSLSREEMQKRQEEFEYRLVNNIADMRQRMDLLVLMMSRIYPFDVEMVVELLKMAEDEANTLFEEVQTYAFVKSLPDGRISLHDEMRRMVNEHVWPEVDPDRERRRRDSRLAAAYLKRKTQSLTQHIEQLREDKQKAEQEGNVQVAFDAEMALDTLGQERWVLQEQQLEHALFADPDEGVALYAELFDAATRAYRFLTRERLVATVQSYRQQLSPDQMFALESRQLNYLIDRGEYLEARNLVTKILGRSDITSEQQVWGLMRHGDIEIRLANFEEGISLFEQAVSVCKNPALENRSVLAEKAVGYGNRLIGNWNEAASHYRIALKLALRLDMEEQQGWLLNNLAFVYGYRRQWNEALALSNQAMGLWDRIQSPRGIGAAKSTRGSVLYMMGSYEESLRYLKEAADIFEPQNDLEWLSTVYAWRGATLMSMRRLEEARQSMEQARAIGLRRDRAMILHRLSRILLDMERYNESREIAIQTYAAAVEDRSVIYEIAALETLAYLDVVQGNFSDLDALQEKCDSYLKREKHPRILSLGRFYGSLGSLAVGLKRLDGAIDYYKRGLNLMAQYGDFGDITLGRQLSVMEEALTRLASPAFIRRLGRVLTEYWEANELDIRNPEALPVFSRWERWTEQIPESTHE